MDEVERLTRELMSRTSVTPDDNGCQIIIENQLVEAGFETTFYNFGDVSNLWARHGAADPVVVLAGHTDVVPAGDPAWWQTDPWMPTVRDGYLYGRGAADMKSSLAAMVVAAGRFVAAHPDHDGSLAMLLTSDEEGPAVDGTCRALAALADAGVRCRYCIVGEPSSSSRLGDTVRNGRRGSLGGELTVHGVQGHVAYPDDADNPIHRSLPALGELTAIRWDEGNAFFPPTTLQISNIHAGTGAGNVIPGQLRVSFNFRYCTEHTADVLMARVTELLDRHRLDYEVTWAHSGAPFLTSPGHLTDAVCASVQSVLNLTPGLSTSGGTSDGRFFAPTGCEVVELGHVNDTIHKVDERVALADLAPLADVYERCLERLLAS